MNFKIYLIIVSLGISVIAKSQTRLSLPDVIRIATDSSLSAFKAKNLYLSGYWEYRTYTAQKKPTLTLNTTPFDYNRALIKRYNSEQNIDEYKQQQSFSSYANASVNQNLPFSGGSLYFDSELGRLQSYGESKYIQYTTVPFRVGLSQPIFGYNRFKWQRRIEPLKFEKAKKSYIQSTEMISLQIVDYFFDLLVADMKVTMAGTNVANADTMYSIGQKRSEIATLSLAELLTLKVDALNARNEMAEAKKQLKNARFLFYSYLRKPENTQLELVVPENFSTYELNYEEALSLAKSNNPDLLANQQQLLESASNLEQTKRNGLMNASLTGSLGFNQQNAQLYKAYQNPMDQQRATLGITMPLIDWGQRRGNYNMAKKNYEATCLTVEQANVDFQQRVMMAVTNFNMQQDIIKSALETRNVARQAYESTRQRFLIGKADVNSLGLALDRQDKATLNYLESLRSYWTYYYTIRQLTLYDFENKKALSQNFDDIIARQ